MDARAGAVEDVLWMIRGPWVAYAIRAGVELGIFDALVEPLAPDDLAQATGCEPAGLLRLIRVLADLGLLEETDGRHALTERGRTLLASDPSTLSALAKMQSEPAPLAGWRQLATALRTRSATFDGDYWSYLTADPRRQADFDAAMSRRAPAQVDAIRSSCDLGGVGTVVDVGGGRGAMLSLLLQAEPSLTGIVADRPDVAVAADATFAADGLTDRARGVATDFFREVPRGGDLYTISSVLHDWDDEDCVRILSRVREAMAPGARLWVVEAVLDSPGRTAYDTRDLHLLDLHMLVMFGARERTLGEYGELLAAAGFDRGRLLTRGQAWDVIEARPAAPGPGTAGSAPGPAR